MPRRSDSRQAPVQAWSVTTRAPRRFRSADLDPPEGPRLRSALAREHARSPFVPIDVRDAVERVRGVAEALGLEAVTVRGGVDVGGAELDHIWVVLDGGVVVDVVLPIRASSFAALVRAYVAGDVGPDELDRAAHGHPLEARVIGGVPGGCRYVGLPVWGASLPASEPASQVRTAER